MLQHFRAVTCIAGLPHTIGFVAVHVLHHTTRAEASVTGGQYATLFAQAHIKQLS